MKEKREEEEKKENEKNLSLSRHHTASSSLKYLFELSTPLPFIIPPPPLYTNDSSSSFPNTIEYTPHRATKGCDRERREREKKKMDRDDLVFKAKLAEQAERCGARRVDAFGGGFRIFFFALCVCATTMPMSYMVN